LPFSLDPTELQAIGHGLNPQEADHIRLNLYGSVSLASGYRIDPIDWID